MSSTGKILSAVGGIITLVSTFLLSLMAFTSTSFASGLGFAINLPDLFTSGDMLLIILAIVLIIFLVSGVLQIIGIANRASAIVGSILPILVAIFFIIYAFGVIPSDIAIYLDVFSGEQYFGFLPYHLQIWELGLGTFTLLGGGVIGLIGGILPREDFYY
ncbi:MAG: hypothetical protein P8Y70_15405 [Candidatus Lokiarchaeota archaeon]